MKEKECLQCGKQFKPKRSTSKYCSQECQWLSMTKRDLSIHICKVCGKEFVIQIREIGTPSGVALNLG